MLVTGGLSGVLAIDVDSQAAHEELARRLGELPIAPRAISGSADPHRYHLFFSHPEFATKAKSTPWHPKLEFRGQAGLIVLPPSVHRSGRRYAWESGRSIFDIGLPALPDPILTALRPDDATTTPVSSNFILDTTADMSPSTREFLSGRYADGPKWNERMFRAACDLNARGMLQQQATSILLSGARPWNAAETELAMRTIESAYAESREPSYR